LNRVGNGRKIEENIQNREIRETRGNRRNREYNDLLAIAHFFFVCF
jgi:hypothetical protein